MAGYFTAVFKYDDFEALKADPSYVRIFELANVEDGPVRVTALSHDDEFTRAELYREAIERHRDRSDLEDEVDGIEQAESVHEFRRARDQ